MSIAHQKNPSEAPSQAPSQATLKTFTSYPGHDKESAYEVWTGPILVVRPSLLS